MRHWIKQNLTIPSIILIITILSSAVILWGNIPSRLSSAESKLMRFESFNATNQILYNKLDNHEFRILKIEDLTGGMSLKLQKVETQNEEIIKKVDILLNHILTTKDKSN